jgi:crossover junction endodeoxyribonuclease RuvC
VVTQAVCGYGRADKAQVQPLPKALLGLERTPTPTHSADALAVAFCHASAPALLRLTG